MAYDRAPREPHGTKRLNANECRGGAVPILVRGDVVCVCVHLVHILTSRPPGAVALDAVVLRISRYPVRFCNS